MNKCGHLLVMEDSNEDYLTVLDALQLAAVSIDVRRVMSGDDCLRSLKESTIIQFALPKLLLIDLNTPKSDGRDTILEIKKDVRLMAIPIVVISGSANPRDVNFCYANGVNAYHVKPVIHAQHLMVLQGLLRYWLTAVTHPSESATAQ